MFHECSEAFQRVLFQMMFHYGGFAFCRFRMNSKHFYQKLASQIKAIADLPANTLPICRQLYLAVVLLIC